MLDFVFRRRSAAHQHDDFVRLAYRELLGREPDPGGWKYFREQLHSGRTTWESMLGEIAASREYELNQAGRAPQPGMQRPRLCFLHIEKTAGTSFTDYLLELYPPSDLFPVRYGQLHDVPDEDFLRARLYSGHFWYSLCTRIPAETQFVTFLRKPVDRLLSMYYFWRSLKWELLEGPDRDPPRLAKTHDLAGFLRHPYGAVIASNIMVRRLAKDQSCEAATGTPECLAQAISTLDSLRFTGIVEMYNLSLLLFAKTFGFPLPSRAYRRLGADEIRVHPNHEPVEHEPVTPEISHLLSEFTKWDDNLYSHGVNLLRRRFAATFGLTIP